MPGWMVGKARSSGALAVRTLAARALRPTGGAELHGHLLHAGLSPCPVGQLPSEPARGEPVTWAPGPSFLIWRMGPIKHFSMPVVRRGLEEASCLAGGEGKKE